MDDAIGRFQAASEVNDVDTMMATLAPDAELVSPLSGRMVFRGHGDLRVLLSAVYGSLAGLRWTEEVGDGPVQVRIGVARVGPLQLTDAMVFDLASDGRIRRIRPHLRPWFAVTLFAVILGQKLSRHPGVLWRARSG